MRACVTALMTVFAIAPIASSIAQTAGSGQGRPTVNEHRIQRPDELTWQAAPPALPPGSQIVVLHGDPSAKSGDFVLRLRAPAGYHIPPHSHPTNESLTIVSGALLYGMSGPADRSKAAALPAGSYAYLPANTPHTIWAGNDGVVVEVHGTAPFDLIYVNRADDPRKQQASTGE